MTVSKEDALAELYRRGALKGRQKAAYEEAAKRGLVGAESKALADARNRVKSAPGQVRAIAQGASFGFADELDAFGAGLETSFGNIAKAVTGKPIAYTPQQAQAAVLQANREADKGFMAEHPVQSIGLNIVGGLGTGGGGSWIGGARSLPGVIGRSAAVGAGLGAVGGAGAAEGGFADRLAGAGKGAAVGGAVGGAIPVAARLSQSAGNAASGAGRTVVRAANRASGGRILDPQQEAARRLSEAMRADGLDQGTVARAIQTWTDTGSLPPSLIDVMGRNTRRLVRAAAAPGGEAETIAAGYVNRVGADLQDNAIGLAERLTPYEGRNANRFGEAIDDAQQTTARIDYAEPYAQTHNITPEIRSALGGRYGSAAVDRALAGAEAARNPTQIAELTALRRAIGTRGALPGERPLTAYNTMTAAEPPLPPVSGATLDRIQIALREMGDNAATSLTNRKMDIAAGLRGRRADVNSALDNFEGLADARGTYRAFSQNREALALGSENPLSNTSFADQLADITGENPMARLSAGVGVRSNIVDSIGSPAANATGYLNRLSSGTNTGRVLGATFGDEAAGQFRSGVRNEINRVNNARFVDPSTNSQTASRLMDESLVSAPSIPTNPVAIAGAVFDKIRRSATLTDAERAAIAEIGLGDATAGLNALQTIGSGRPVDPRVAAILARLAASTQQVSAQRSISNPAVYVESVGDQRFTPQGVAIP